MAPDSLIGSKPQLGEVILGKYALTRVLGSGGMGVVFAAHHLELDRQVAVKFLHTGFDNAEVAARFLREARAAVRIESEHVARVLDVGRLDDRTPFMVMEYLEGFDLSAVIEQGQLSITDAVDYVVQACSAMVEAHQLGIVHRDLKPANLFLTYRRDGSPSIKVLDFGISKWNEPDSSRAMLTNPTEFLGSPVYMSPEQLKSAQMVDHRTDIWSLGVILFELLTGRPAFSAPSLALLMAAILQEPPGDLRQLRPEVSPELSLVVQRCLVKDRELRFQSIGELANALLPFAPQRSHWNIERISKVSGLSTPPPGLGSVPPASNSSSASSGAHAGIASAPVPGASTAQLTGSGTGTAVSANAGPKRDVTVTPWVGEPSADKGQRSKRALKLGAVAVVIAAAGGGLFLAINRTGPQPSAEPSAATSPAQPEANVGVAREVPQINPVLEASLTQELRTTAPAAQEPGSAAAASVSAASASAAGVSSAALNPTVPELNAPRPARPARPAPAATAKQEPRPERPKPPANNPLEMDLK